MLLKIDFDNNSNNRRNALEGFFENATYTILELLENNMIKIKNTETGEIKNVFKSRLKKILINRFRTKKSWVFIYCVKNTYAYP